MVLKQNYFGIKTIQQFSVHDWNHDMFMLRQVVKIRKKTIVRTISVCISFGLFAYQSLWKIFKPPEKRLYYFYIPNPLTRVYNLFAILIDKLLLNSIKNYV